MPVYEYECPECEKSFEVQQRIADAPLKKCPDCGGEVKKLISMSSFQLKGGGWYADGYSQSSGSNGKENKAPAPPCQGGSSGNGSCASCPAAAQASS